MGYLYYIFMFFHILPNYAIAMVLSRNFSQTRNQIQYGLIRASVPGMKLVNSQSGSYRKQLMPQTYSKRGYTTLKNFLCKINRISHFIRIDRKSTRLNSSHVASSYA